MPRERHWPQPQPQPQPYKARSPDRRRLPVLLVAAMFTGCGGGDGGVTTVNADTGGSSGTGGPPLPGFAEPASGRVQLTVYRDADLRLSLLNVVPGATDLVIDGHTLGPLGDGAAAGQLDANALTLRVRGGLVLGEHRMMLRTADLEGRDESEEVIVDIRPNAERHPTATLDLDTGLPGRQLLTTGAGDDELLLVLDPSVDPPTLHLLPRRPSGTAPGESEPSWDPEGVRTVALPGLVLDSSERPMPVSALRYDHTDDDPGRLRVAWRVGSPGNAVAIIDATWDQATPKAPPRLTIDQAPFVGEHPAQWAQLGRPWLVGDRLVTELYAPLDVESPRPGDHRLMHTRLHEQADGFDPPQRITVGPDQVDLDHLGPALDRIAVAAGQPPPLSIRADRLQPLVLQLDDAGAFRPHFTEVTPSDDDIGFATLPVATVLGAFGSRTAVSLSTRPSSRLRVSLLGDFSGSVRVATFGVTDLPDFPNITGETAPAIVDGLTTFAVPYGDARPVHLVYPLGSGAQFVVPDDTMRCQGVAAAYTATGPTTPLACTRDGTVWLGALSVVESER